VSLVETVFKRHELSIRSLALAELDTQKTFLRKTAGNGALKAKKMAASRLRCNHSRRLESDSGCDSRSFGMCCAQFNIGQTRGFSREMIVGHAAVGIQELRCTGGAGETTIPVEVVAHSPAD
jgi:hypothetical protein